MVNRKAIEEKRATEESLWHARKDKRNGFG
jgi:hypothetical protein